MFKESDDKEVRSMPKTHYFSEDRVHYVWDNELEAALTVEPGDTVVYHTREVSDGQIGPDSDAGALDALDWERLYPLAGPVEMANAEPGDVLTVEVLDIHTAGWGWAAVLPGFGLLPEDFPDAYLKVFDLTNGDYTFFKDDIVIPIEPFFGTMGVCPAGPEKPLIMPPGPFGGNMDTRHITKGTILYLPVQHEGALFSCGDAHAAQGDGEVCVTGIESPWYATMGVNEDLMQAAKDSLRAMVEHVSATYGLDPVEAYVLASLVVDLKISEIVDQPNWIVSSYLPL